MNFFLIPQTLSQNQTLHGYVAYKWSYGHSCHFLAYFGQNLVSMVTSLDACNVFFGLVDHENSVISNHILVISRTFICIYSNFCPKIGCHGNAPLSLVFGSVTWIPRWHKPYLETKLCMDMWLTTEVMAIFVTFGLYWPWQRPLDPCSQKCLLWIGRPGKPPIISNSILVIYCRNAFIRIYSNYSPKIGCHCNASLSLMYWSVTDEFPDSTNPISKPNSAWICWIQLKLCSFLWFIGLFWRKFGCHGNVP